ncbi:hypothetical protein P879_03999 [Paragonimus westermani]|uniref:Uncharacterized protein n=1 Tax=Paragonimus westermani TaxID=34504 RepID=A0A8T0D3H5_9TREM|nr:hypothetical protein P879_03999 [Paragonimus westermani]
MKYTLIILLAVLLAQDTVHCADDNTDDVECEKVADQIVWNFVIQMRRTMDDLGCLIETRVKKYLEKDGLGLKLLEFGKILNKKFASKLDELSMYY